ncbi:MAG: twin-arginine translocase subunit TatC [Actinomycetota bacterium]|nr:twin-arginine translocase subunit TatC [Actinomycetota bacterium]
MLRRARRPVNPEGRMSVLDHLRELRRRLIIVMVMIAAGAIIGWIVYNPLLAILKEPYCNIPYQHRLGALNQSRAQCKLLFGAPLDGFTIRLKVSVVAGSILTAPLWLYQLWAFVTPGLRKHEKRWTVVFVLTSTLLFALGMGLAFFTLYKGLNVLITQAGSGTQAALTVNYYISFVILVLVVFGASFELPLLVVMLNAVRVLPFSILKRGQRLGIFLIFLFAAVATPSTDPFTMVAMAVPMVLLFELSVLWCFLYDRRRARRELAGEHEQLPDDVASSVDPIPERLDRPTGRGPDDSEWTDLP